VEIDEVFESLEELKAEMERVEREMKEAAKNYEFEKAAVLRDRLFSLRQLALKWA